MKKIKPVKYYFSNEKRLYRDIKNIFGYYPGNIFLYKLAFLHKSAAYELNGVKISNERLEYLGDAILSAVVADFLFKLFPYKGEGFLTEMRSKIVSRVSLNKLSLKLGLDKLIRSNRDSANHYKSMQGDAFEAFVGALYLDKGYKFTYKILINNVVRLHFNIEELQRTEVNHKSRLIEWGQKEKRMVKFKVVDEVGTGVSKQYVVEALIEGKPYGRASDYSIKGAEKIVSEKVWNKLNNK